MKISNSFSSLQTFIIIASLLIVGQASASVSYTMPLKGQEHIIGNLIKWETSMELNSKQFLVEKSQDGISYSSIGEVASEGDDFNGRGYRFLDINATTEKSFYRLKQIDVDGTTNLSEIVLVKRVTANNFMVVNMSSTSTNKYFTTAIDVMIEADLKYELHNAAQEKVQSGTIEAYNGLNELVINLTDEAEGIYFLRLQVENELEVLTIRKVMDEAQTKENVAVKY